MRQLISLVTSFCVFSSVAQANESASISTEEREKCEDTSYFARARDFFSCDTTWSLDACASLTATGGSAAGAVLGGTIGPLRAQARLHSAFAQWEAQERVAMQLSNAKNYHYQEASRIAQTNGWALRYLTRNSYDPDLKEEFKKLEASMPKEKFEKVTKDYLYHSRKETDLERERDKQWDKTDDLAKKWKIRDAAQARSPTLREAFHKMSVAEGNLIRDSYKSVDHDVFVKHFPQHADAKETASTHANVRTATEELARARESFRDKWVREHVGRLRGLAVVRGGLAGAAAGGALGVLPYAINYLNSQTCDNLANQKGARDHLTISAGTKDCTVALEDHQEMELLTQTPKERSALFNKFPILCKAFLKKQEERHARFAKLNVRPTLTECSEGKAVATIETYSRKYDYVIQNVNGKLTITSPLGTGNETPGNPIRLGWAFLPQSNSLGSAQLDPSSAWPALNSNRGNLESLRLQQAMGASFKPLSKMSDDAKGRSAMSTAFDKDVMNTVAEQTVALKQGMPQILAACGFLQDKMDSSGKDGSTGSSPKTTD